jgi:hypothetical protein
VRWGWNDLRKGSGHHLIRSLLNDDVICMSLCSHLRQFSLNDALAICITHLFILIDSLIRHCVLGGALVYKIIFFGGLSAVYIIVWNSVQRILLVLKCRRLLNPAIWIEHLRVVNWRCGKNLVVLHLLIQLVDIAYVAKISIVIMLVVNLNIEGY